MTMVGRYLARQILVALVFCSTGWAQENDVAQCPSGLPPLKNETTGDPIWCDDIDTLCPMKNFQCILDEGHNGTVDGICCPKISALQPRADGCPAGMRPMRTAAGQLLACSTVVANTCPSPERTICYRSVFGAICCTVEGDYCPPGYEQYNYPGTALPLICGSPTGNCPTGYQCLRSPLSGSPYACCRPRQTPPVQCPFGFQPWISSTGAPVTCIVGNPVNCPAPSVCVASSDPFQSYCCIPTSTQLQCPNGYALPTSGQTVPCTLQIGGTNTCPLGSSCKPSIGASGGVCCRSLARCPSGYQETINPVTQEIVECSGSVSQPVTCPFGSTCLLSSTTVSSLCCTPVTTIAPPGQCPAGFDLVPPLVSPCQLDFQCPLGARCLQSVCCRPSMGAQCPSGFIALLDQNNRPVACSSTDLWCPVAEADCLQSITTGGFICCVRNPQWPQCPSGMTITLFGGQPIPCTDVPNACPPGSSCETSLTPATPARICCQSGGSTTPICPRSLTLVLGSDGRPVFCSPGGCTAPATCERATNMAVDVCCRDDSGPVGGRRCPTGFQVQRNTGGQFVTCDPTVVTPCTSGGFCLPSVINDAESTTETICCQAVGVQCPPGFNRPEGTTSAVTCDASAPNPCSNLGLQGVSCRDAVGTGVGTQRSSLCCQQSALCANSRLPYYDQTYHPKGCVINRPNECNDQYRCEIPSTGSGNGICCPRPRTAAADEDGVNSMLVISAEAEED